jgi:hypothetical protein
VDRFGAPLQWQGTAVIGALVLMPMLVRWLGTAAALAIVGAFAAAVIVSVLLVRRRRDRQGGEP